MSDNMKFEGRYLVLIPEQRTNTAVKNQVDYEGSS